MLVVLWYVIIIVYIFGFCLWLASRKYRHYPGLGLPIVGDLYQSFTTYTTSFEKVVKDVRDGVEKYGDIYCKRFGPAVLIIISDPILIEKLSNHPLMANKEPFVYIRFSPMFKGFFTRPYSDDKWKRERRNFVTSMSKASLNIFNDVFVRRSLELVDIMEKETGEFDIQYFATLSALDVVFETLTKISFTNLKDKNYPCYEELRRVDGEVISRLLDLGLRRLDSKYAKSLKHTWSCLSQCLDKMIQELEYGRGMPRTEQGHLTYIQKLVREKLEQGYPVEKLMPYLSEVVLEAFYVTSATISAALLYLGVYQECQKKAWAEQNEIFGDSLKNPTQDDLKKMLYLERVLKEVVRLLGAACFARRSEGDIKIDNHFIPKNSTVVYFNALIREDPRYWKNPKTFDPDHFLPDEAANRPKCAFLGFGIGIRNCPGFQYGMNYGKIVLSTVLRKFKINARFAPEDLTFFRPSIFMRLDVPHMISVEPR